MSIYRDFEEFVADLFERYELNVIKSQISDKGYDLKVFSKTGVFAIVEIKFYQSLKIAPAILRTTFIQIASAKLSADATQAIFVTNARVSAVQRQENKQIIIWDYDVVSFLAGGYPDLAERWERLSQEGFIYRSEALPEPIRPETIEFLDPPQTPPRQEYVPPERRERRGEELCNRMKAIKPGAGKLAPEFEAVCIEALKYLFDTDLINWTPQKNSYNRLHRYDIIARISSQNDFWISLISDHRARYIIFEFKNYKDKITQAEIYSTEKYLFPQAMRSTAIIISRKGASKNAKSVIYGAFRENGKLIVSIDIDQMCNMLHKRDDGDDPTSILSAAIEDMMVGLER